jgi:hypothetical protein
MQPGGTVPVRITVQLRCGCFSFGDCKSPSAKVKMVVSRRGCLDHKNKVSVKVGSETRLHRNVIKLDLIRRRVASIQEVMTRWSNRTCSLRLYLPYPRGNGRSSVRNGSWLAAHGSHLSMGGGAGTRKAQRPCKGLVSQSICKPNQPSSAIPDLTASLQCRPPLSATRCPQGRPRAMQQSQEVTWLF